MYLNRCYAINRIGLIQRKFQVKIKLVILSGYGLYLSSWRNTLTYTRTYKPILTHTHTNTEINSTLTFTYTFSWKLTHTYTWNTLTHTVKDKHTLNVHIYTHSYYIDFMENFLRCSSVVVKCLWVSLIMYVMSQCLPYLLIVMLTSNPIRRSWSLIKLSNNKYYENIDYMTVDIR